MPTPLSSTAPRTDARTRAAWQTQVAAARQTPGLVPLLLRQRHELLPRFAATYHQLRTLPKRMRRHLQRQWCASLGGLALLLTLGHAPALAATINVSGACTLSKAIEAANNNSTAGGVCTQGSGADTVVLTAGSTHTLTAVDNTTYGPTGLPVITSPITIVGNGSTVARSGVTPFRLLAVGTSGDLTVEQLTLQNGLAAGAGGGSTGGGMYNKGTVLFSECTLTGNSASTYGGGVSNYGTLTLNQSTLTGNSAQARGGGVFNGSTDTLILRESTLSGNSTVNGGGASNYGTLTLSRSTLSGNVATTSGGGVFNGSTGTLSLRESTLSGNSAQAKGGGVYTKGVTVTAEYNILSGNLAALGPEFYLKAGTYDFNDDNLFGEDNDAGLVGALAGPTDVVPKKGVLHSEILAATLAFNGGPTQTLNLLEDSPAPDLIPPPFCPPTDQRGFLRPSEGKPNCDAGAVEFLSAAPAKVNSSLTFVLLPATFSTTTSVPSQCPTGTTWAGAFSFQGLLAVKAGQATLEALKTQTVTLSGGNVLLLADGGAAGAVGTQYTFPEVGQFSDEELAAGESLPVPFVMCLKTFNKFAFFVDVLGHTVSPPP